MWITYEYFVDGDVNIEMMVTSMGKKSRSSGSGKRVHSQMMDGDLACLDWKKKKNRIAFTCEVNDDDDDDDDMRSVVGESVDDAMNVDVVVVSTRFSGMIRWLTEVAKGPCDKKLGSLPQCSKWNCCGSQETWKQVLLAREVLLVKRSVSVDSKWQKTQRMHPYMYDDQSGYSPRLRDRFKKNFAWKVSSKGSCTILIDDDGDGNVTSDSSTADSLFHNQPRLRYRVGLRFQAEVPKWNGLMSESNSKWLGTQVWPLLKQERRSLIERDPVGKCRQETCGCVSRGSVDCVRFHIAEKRFKLKLELGSAFFFWRFNKMGEEATLPWTKREEDKFSEIVKVSRLSEPKSFWDKMLEAFPGKRREELVGYYFNVFLLKRREHQNRHSPLFINSDDEESESGVSTSILYSPARPKSKF